MTGKTVSHYRVLAKLGEGGMGIVYKAEDEKLKRTVALKFVPPGALDEPELRARFLHEAQAAAALSHPNVCTVYEIDEERGFLAMEYVEGESVQARIRKRPLPVAEALDIAIHAAEGLQAAHEHGVVHRDIKSANLMLTPQGGVKIMDFGLARLSDRTRLTKTGMTMGTPACMSPEQAQGKEVDRRTDLWGLGVVLYEMVAGRLPFRGEGDAAVVHAILYDDPEPVTALRADVPLELDRVIGKALGKSPGERYQHAEDFIVDLRRVRSGLQQDSRAERKAAGRERRRLVAGFALAGLVVGAAGVWLWGAWQARTARPLPAVRFAIDLPKGSVIRPTWNPGLSFSPDGAVLAFPVVGGDRPGIHLRRLDGLEIEPLADGAGLGIPSFSPDGQYVAAMDMPKMQIVKASLRGGAPIPIAPYDMAFAGEWAPDNYYYWTSHYFGPIIRHPMAGGKEAKEEQVTQLDSSKQERTHRHARMLPGGKALVFTVSAGGMDSYEDARIDAFLLNSKTRRNLVQGGFSPRYSPSGHLLYARGGSIYAVPLDAGSAEVKGPPLKVVDGVFMSRNTGSAWFTVSSRGDLAYAEGKVDGGERTIVSVDRTGKEEPLPLPRRSYLFPRLSPDGKLLAFEVEGVNHDLYTYDPERGVTTKLTTDGVSHAPVWTPDGKRLAFRSWKAGTMTMWWMPADRSGPEELLTKVALRSSLVGFSPDGRFATYNEMEPGSPFASDIYVLPLGGERVPQALAKSRFLKGSGRFSRDGKWVAYCSAESGRPEVFVQPWPGPGPKIQVSSDGGIDPTWSPDGKELFYRNGDKMMVVEVSTQPTFKASMPRVLWEGHYSIGMSNSCGMLGAMSANYDVSPDGRRFLMIKDANQDAVSTRIVVVLNFGEELKRLAKEAKP